MEFERIKRSLAEEVRRNNGLAEMASGDQLPFKQGYNDKAEEMAAALKCVDLCERYLSAQPPHLRS